MERGKCIKRRERKGTGSTFKELSYNANKTVKCLTLWEDLFVGGFVGGESRREKRNYFRTPTSNISKCVIPDVRGICHIKRQGVSTVIQSANACVYFLSMRLL